MRGTLKVPRIFFSRVFFIRLTHVPFLFGQVFPVSRRMRFGDIIL
jgi:hypothetical protein